MSKAKKDGRMEGKLIPLKTTLETRARETTVEVWVTAVEAKLASDTLNIIRKHLPEEGGVDLQHLRRFVKMADVPAAVEEPARLGLVNQHKLAQTPVILSQDKESSLETEGSLQDENPSEIRSGTWMSTANSSKDPELKATQDSHKDKRPKLSEDNSSKRLLLISSAGAITQAELCEVLSTKINAPFVFSIRVPLLAPTSQKQATLWSKKYWPTVYKKNNPFGPHPSIISRAEDEIREEVAKWMRLASDVAQEAKNSEFGESIGVVIVERKNGTSRPLALAADGRWLDWPRVGSGNVAAHAVLRAIAMVAEGLRTRDDLKSAKEKSSTPPVMESSTTENTIFKDQPILSVEREHLDTTDNEDGYLCNNLEIYCTHEPCVMCAMAIVHSRFGRLVFGKRMPETGGICADSDLGHGLFRRKELNWTLLAWQWESSLQDGEMQPPSFNA